MREPVHAPARKTPFVLYAFYPRCLNAMDERQFEQQHDKMIPLL